MVPGLGGVSILYKSPVYARIARSASQTEKRSRIGAYYVTFASKPSQFGTTAKL